MLYFIINFITNKVPKEIVVLIFFVSIGNNIPMIYGNFTKNKTFFCNHIPNNTVAHMRSGYQKDSRFLDKPIR